MTWGKMDDKFHRNRKVRELRRTKAGREALGCWAFWWSWCLDDSALTGLVPEVELDANDKRAAKMLTDVGLWEATEGGFQFHDFREYNPTREQREAKKEADRVRVAARRNASRENVACDTDASRERVASESHPTRVPVPTQPNQSPLVPPPAAETAQQPSGPFAIEKLIESTFSKLKQEAWLKKTGNPGGRFLRGPRDFDAMAHVVAFFSAESDPKSAIEDSISGYLRDDWAIGASWPFVAWARDPGSHQGTAPQDARLPAQETAKKRLEIEERLVAARKHERALAGTEGGKERKRVVDVIMTELRTLNLSEYS